MKSARREAEALVERLGGKVVDVTNGKHFKFDCRFGDRTIRMIVPISPSDRRWIKNKEAWLRRALNDNPTRP